MDEGAPVGRAADSDDGKDEDGDVEMAEHQARAAVDAALLAAEADAAAGAQALADAQALAEVVANAAREAAAETKVADEQKAAAAVAAEQAAMDDDEEEVPAPAHTPAQVAAAKKKVNLRVHTSQRRRVFGPASDAALCGVLLMRS